MPELQHIFADQSRGFNSHTAPKRNLHKGIKRKFWYMYVLGCSAHNVECMSFSGTFEGIELKVLCVLGLK